MNIPDRIAQLPKDDVGRPVPFFVEYVDGKPDFRIFDPEKLGRCYREKRCWVCGDKLGVHRAFVIGPMCAVNRVSSEPPSHLDCAIFSAQACPFLSTPKMKRRERNMPACGVRDPGGVMIRRNPGVTLVWVTRTFWLHPDQRGGLVFLIGKPEQTLWFCEGRTATRAEILASIDSGFPALEAEALKEGGADALRQLGRELKEALALVPQT